MLCIGGCCIPLSLFWPLIILAIHPIYNYLASMFGWKPLSANPISNKTASCCANEKKNTVENSSSEEINNSNNDTSKTEEPSNEAYEIIKKSNYVVLNKDTNSTVSLEEIIVANNNKITFVKFTAEWCKPCKEIEPHFIDLSKKHPDATFVSVDIEHHEDTAISYGARSIPLFLALEPNTGKELGKLSGKDKDKLTNLVHEFKTN